MQLHRDQKGTCKKEDAKPPHEPRLAHGMNVQPGKHVKDETDRKPQSKSTGKSPRTTKMPQAEGLESRTDKAKEKGEGKDEPKHHSSKASSPQRTNRLQDREAATPWTVGTPGESRACQKGSG